MGITLQLTEGFQGNRERPGQVAARALLRSLGNSDAKVRRWHQIVTPHCVTSAGNFRAKDLLIKKPERG